MKKKSCFHCNGKLVPTTKNDVMGSPDNIIHIQIYNCIDCGLETKIPVYPESPMTLGDDELLMKNIDELHNDPNS